VQCGQLRKELLGGKAALADGFGNDDKGVLARFRVPADKFKPYAGLVSYY
jgi:hypothetical protein